MFDVFLTLNLVRADILHAQVKYRAADTITLNNIYKLKLESVQTLLKTFVYLILFWPVSYLFLVLLTPRSDVLTAERASFQGLFGKTEW